jgi:DNA-binding protein YbaB
MTNQAQHPRVTDALQLTQQFSSILEDDRYRARNASFTATDETATVTATVNGDRWLTGLQIEHGLLRQGAESVRQRINEAIHNAALAATYAASQSTQAQLTEKLTDIVSQLQEQLGDLPTTQGDLPA